MAKKKNLAPKQAMKKKDVVKKKKAKINTPKVRVVINSSYNNTIVSVSDYMGNVIANASGGSVGFSGSRKSTGFAATRAGEEAAKKAMKQGATEAQVVVKGLGEGRQAAVKGIRAAGLRITTLSDFTPIPHGGTRPRRFPKK